MKTHLLAAAATVAAALSLSTASAFTASNHPRVQGIANIVHGSAAPSALFSTTTEAAESSNPISSPATTLDMPPYSTWEWNTHIGGSENTKTTHSINYLSMGDTSKPTLLLVHGFGASSYHFRYNIPELAKDYHVYAIDMLGFGWSDKPIMDYDASVWRDQVIEFIDQVIHTEKEDKSIAIAGNSLGGYTAMYAASDDRIKEHVRGCILLNAAGRFRPEEGEEETPSDPNPIVKSISSAFQRFVIACSFVITKQPAHIEQILKSVYPSDSSNVNSELVESIRVPALDPNAAEVFYRVITKNGSGPQAFVDDIIKELECPVLLAWGEKDPWIRPAAADKMQMLHAEYHGKNVGGESGSKWIKRVNIDAGHCPHDEAPEAVNAAILGFAAEVF